MASAYAWGFSSLAAAHRENEGPEWFDELDPLDLVILGLVYPKTFTDGAEFGNTRTAWLRKVRATSHWRSVERLVSEAVTLSAQSGLPVDDPQVMFGLNARLESAGLDRQLLPVSLHPANLLAEDRFVRGPSTDIPLPPTATNARHRAEQFLANLEPDFPQDGTCAELLRDGLCLLSRADISLSTESLLLLIALYVGLTSSDDVPRPELGDRAYAWAIGLPAESSLVSIVDAMLAASNRELDPIATLSHLFMIPAFTQQVDQEDRRWHSAPGTDLVPLALEQGHDQVDTHARRAIRLTPSTAAVLQSLLGTRTPHPHISSEPFPHDHESQDFFEQLAGMFRAIDLHPAWAHAFLEDNAPLPRLDGTFRDKVGRQDWENAIDRYLREHPELEVPDTDEELRKLRRYDGMMVIRRALEDSTFAKRLVELLDDDQAGDDSGLDGVRELVAGLELLVMESIDEDDGLWDQALDLAEAWGGTALHDRVQRYTGADFNDEEDEVVLLVLASVYIQRRRADTSASVQPRQRTQ